MRAQAESLSPTIKAVRAITTGYVEQHKEHRYGLVLFDTGLDPALVSDPDDISSPFGRFLLKKIFRIHIGPEDALATALRQH